MAKINYKVTQISPENFEVVKPLDDKDLSLLEGFRVNSIFEEGNHFIQLNIYDLSGKLIVSDPQYNNYKLQLGSTKGTSEASRVQIDPVADLKAYSFHGSEVRLFYNFLNNPYSKVSSPNQFYITAISPDRTEIKLQSVKLTEEEVKTATAKLIEDINSVSYQSETFLYKPQSQLLQIVNVSSEENEEGYSVLLKLYEPLPGEFTIKAQFSIVERVSDAVAYEINTEVEQEEVKPPSLKGPNFNLELETQITDNSNYYNYDELFSYPNTNSYKELESKFKEKSIDISIDYSDFSNFIYFSSAEERLLNFKYKLDLLKDHQKNLREVSTSNLESTQVKNHSYYQNLIDGIIQNFDHYERYLYYVKEDTSWPKINDQKPYILSGSWENEVDKQKNRNLKTFLQGSGTLTPLGNPRLFGDVGSLQGRQEPSKVKVLSNPFGINLSGSITPVITDPNNLINKKRTWYELKLEEAREYDLQNINRLTNTIPEYIKDDSANEPYSIFVDMVGQHFDNIWIYSKAVSEKYDGDNRLTAGISRDLVGEALKNFGVKLYNSEYTTTDLFKYFTKNEYVAPREQITNRVEVDDKQKVGLKDYEQEIYKRIYHNLPLLLKSKGTERGLRALINCFGVPCETLDIKFYGGQTDLQLPFYGGEQPFTASVDKIRIASELDELYYQENSDDNPCKRPYVVLSPSSATEYEYYELTQDQHRMEVGFSPTNDVDNYIVSQSQTLFPNDPFNIDEYIGDPREINSNTYAALEEYKRTILSSITSFDAKDYIRLIKFFDNVLFRMIEDFVPARATVDTGIIIKPHILNRSKYGGVQASVTHHDHSGSIETAFIEGDYGDSFRAAHYPTDKPFPTVYQNSAGRVRHKYEGTNTPKLEPGKASTSHRIVVKTPTTGSKFLQTGGVYARMQDQAKFDGELAGTVITITDGELNRNNIFKNLEIPSIISTQSMFHTIPEIICGYTIGGAIPTFSLLPFYLNDRGREVRSTSTSGKDINYKFTASDLPALYDRHTLVLNRITSSSVAPTSPAPNPGDVWKNNSNYKQYDGSTWQDNVVTSLFRTHQPSQDDSLQNQIYSFNTTQRDQYETFDVLAYDPANFTDGTLVENDDVCFGVAKAKVVYCDLGTTDINRQVIINFPYELADYFTGLSVNTSGSYYASVDGQAETSITTPYTIPSSATTVTITYRDDNDSTCQQTVNLITTACSLDQGRASTVITDLVYFENPSSTEIINNTNYTFVAEKELGTRVPVTPIEYNYLPSDFTTINDGYLINGDDSVEGYLKGFKQLIDAKGTIKYYLEFFKSARRYRKLVNNIYRAEWYIQGTGGVYTPIMPDATKWVGELHDGVTTNSAVEIDLSENSGRLPKFLKDGGNFSTIQSTVAVKTGTESGFDRDNSFKNTLENISNGSLTPTEGTTISLAARLYAVLETDTTCTEYVTPFFEIQPGSYEDVFRIQVKLEGVLHNSSLVVDQANSKNEICFANPDGITAYVERTFLELNSVPDGGVYTIDIRNKGLTQLGTLYGTANVNNDQKFVGETHPGYWIRNFVTSDAKENQDVEVNIGNKTITVRFAFTRPANENHNAYHITNKGWVNYQKCHEGSIAINDNPDIDGPRQQE